MRCFLLSDVLSDPEMAAEMEAGRGAAHYDMDNYLVRAVVHGHSRASSTPA